MAELRWTVGTLLGGAWPAWMAAPGGYGPFDRPVGEPLHATALALVAAAGALLAGDRRPGWRSSDG